MEADSDIDTDKQVWNVDNEKFKFLVDMLKFLESKGAENNGVEDCIIDIVNSLEKELSDQQRAEIYMHILRIEKERRMKDEKNHIMEVLERERYRQLIERAYDYF
ncbi:MAG: hypothetical protein V1802_03310 [Candidatus Aenigmatarchaeota archaeon]